MHPARFAFLLPMMVLSLNPCAWADTPTATYEAVAVPVDCTQAFENKVDATMHFGKAAMITSTVAVAPAAFLTFAALSSGGGGAISFSGTGAIVVGGMYVVAIAVPGTIYLVKKIESRHYREVLSNLEDATDKLYEDKDLKKLAKQVDPKHAHSIQEIAQALIAVNESGALCKDGKLVVTGEFRKLVKEQLNQPTPPADPSPKTVVTQLSGAEAQSLGEATEAANAK